MQEEEEEEEEEERRGKKGRVVALELSHSHLAPSETHRLTHSFSFPKVRFRVPSESNRRSSQETKVLLKGRRF